MTDLPILSGVGKFTRNTKALGSCVDCRYSAHDKDGTLGCRYNPPTAQIVQIPGKLGQVITQTASLFPPLQPDMWCGRFKAVEAVPLRVEQNVNGIAEGMG